MCKYPVQHVGIVRMSCTSGIRSNSAGNVSRLCIIQKICVMSNARPGNALRKYHRRLKGGSDTGRVRRFPTRAAVGPQSKCKTRANIHTQRVQSVIRAVAVASWASSCFIHFETAKWIILAAPATRAGSPEARKHTGTVSNGNSSRNRGRGTQTYKGGAGVCQRPLLHALALM